MGFERLGVRCEVDGADLVVPGNQSLRVQSDLGGHVPTISDQPWPAFPADTMSIAIVTATQCDGMVLMHEKMFESRMFFVDKLIGMGARIVLCDPHRAVVSGPSKLRAATVESPDIRAGMAMLLAALCASGTSVINNVGADRARLRAHRRAPERARRAHPARRRAARPLSTVPPPHPLRDPPTGGRNAPHMWSSRRSPTGASARS
jgi:5-enolpyruvylshikimate-3-phosphate synthase